MHTTEQLAPVCNQGQESSLMAKKKALFISSRTNDIFSPQDQVEAAGLVDVYAPTMTAKQALADSSVLKDMQILLTGWGAPMLDEAFLDAAPNLEAVLYGAGSVRHIITDAFWRRNIVICSAWAANAIPVSEFTLAQILLGLKQTFQAAGYFHEHRNGYPGQHVHGAYGGSVGIISLGMIGRRMVEHLNHFNVNLLAYDPIISKSEAKRLGVTLVDLDELFKSCQVVSLHAPLLEETRGMIRGEHLRLMQPNATFINTARGALVNEPEMIQVLQERPDLHAALDVTDPEPPAKDSPLWGLPNVFLTPHIAGSQGQECYRLGRYMLEDLRRYLAGQPLRWPLARNQVKQMA